MRLIRHILFNLFFLAIIVGVSDNAFAAWIQKAPFGGEAKHRCTAFSIGNKGYIGGGHINSGTVVTFKDYWQYDPGTNSWSQIADFGGGYRYHSTAFSIGNYAYVGLGENHLSAYKNDFWKYIPLINTWVQVANFPGEARRGSCSFVIDDLGYVGTGQTESGYANDFYSYDPTTNTWDTIANFIGIARSSAVAFSHNGKGYVGTGHILGDDTNDFFEYDPLTDLWMQKTDVGTLPRQDATGFVINGEGYIGTGNNVEGNDDFDDFWRYNFDTDTWIEIEDFDGLARCYMVSFVINNVAYCGTGTDGTNFRDFWAYIPFLEEEEFKSELIHVKVYPNPSNDIVYFELIPLKSNDEISVYIFNQYGQLVLNQRLTENKLELNKSTIAPGNYYYQVLSYGNIQSNGKFILTQ